MIPVIIPANNASLWTGATGNNTYLLKGRVPALIDAGVGDAAHVDAVAAALGGLPLAFVLVTHGHSDHVSGLPAIAARWPSVRVVRFPEVSDGRIASGDRQLRVMHTPGHAPDHLCFVDDDAGDVYCGDMLRAEGTIVIPASKGGRLREYLESLRRLRDLSPRRLLPGHGPIIENPAVVIDGYLEHRARREEQVIAALRSGFQTAGEIARAMYSELPPALVAASADSVLAHLVKLQEEGRAKPVASPSEATAGEPHVSPLSAWRLV